MKFLYSALVAVPVAFIIYNNTAWGQRPPETVRQSERGETTQTVTACVHSEGGG